MSDVLTEMHDGVLRLTLSRPGKKNALTRAMYTALTEGLERAAGDDSVRAIVIAAEGSDFCAGNDILDFAQGVADYQSPDIDINELPVFRFLRALTFCDKPLIAAVQGQAVGVGVTLLLHCDLVVAADDARLSLPFLKLGLVPEAGSTLLLPRRIGHARAFGWMALGEKMPAEEALRLGLINRISDAAGLNAAIDQMTAAICALSPAAVRHTKQLMRDPAETWAVVEEEARIFRRLLSSPEAMAAFTAFLSR